MTTHRLTTCPNPRLLGVLVMGVAIAFGFAPRSESLLARWQEAPQRVAEALDGGMDQVLAEVEASIKVNELSGKAGSGGGGNTPVGLRSGNLRQDITHERDEGLAGTVGTTQRTSHYARAILGPDTTTITPVNAENIWVPIADNLNPSKVARYSPRELFDEFDEDRIDIFTSKAGNTVVFLRDPKTEDGGNDRFKRNTKAGRKKGDLKGRLMFVLKDQVVIEGTDALAEGAENMRPRIAEIFDVRLDGVRRFLNG